MDTIDQIKENLNQEIEKVDNIDQLNDLKVKYLGKKGEISMLMPKLKELPNELKREFGQAVNNIKTFAEKAIEDLKAKIENKQIQDKLLNQEKIDITMPVDTSLGSLHPRTILQKEIEDIFVGMGFNVESGREVESEYNNFDSVNVPKNHPARDMQDTFWLNNGELLKTQTSAAQNAILRKYNGPLRAIFPGRCFRNEAVDHSHENTFFQLEGILVDEQVSVANLIFFMKKMLSELFKKDIEIRLRPGFFPFVEPGFEMDACCTFCGGKGCSVCKHSGWLELCPCGMIHPKVLEYAGLDSDKYCGFAFGLGFDRLVMLQTGINDIRYLNSGNLKVLNQFKVEV